MKITITGAGIICAIGNNTQEAIASFEKHKSGIGPIKYLETAHKAIFPVGEVKLSNEELALKAGLDPNLSRTILLSYIAAKEAMDSLPDHIADKYRIGFLSGTSVGGMDKTTAFYKDFLADEPSADLQMIENHDCGKSTDFVANKLGISDFVTTVSTACSSSANSIMLASRMIQNDMLDIAIAGGVDSLTSFTFNGFNTLMILDHEQCKPLEKRRQGLNLGEGAAFVVMMNEKTANEIAANIFCYLSGYGNANDGHHQTALSDEGTGPYLAMKAALEKSGLAPEAIDYINMHGTGTQNNDLVEGRAIERLFALCHPKVSSTKSFTGHTLGASGAIEAVFSALAVKKGFIYPNFQYLEPMEENQLSVVKEFSKGVDIRHVMSNSFGFGGNCSSLIFSKF